MRAEITASPSGIPTIKIDGHDIADAISGYRLEQDADDLVPVLTVELPISEIASYTGDVRLHIASATCDLLIEHGWTPPEENDQ